MIMNTLSSHKMKLWRLVVSIIAVISIIYGSYNLWLRFNSTHQTPKVVEASSVITYSTDLPDETPPICDEHNFPDSQPRYIELPTINAAGCIQKVGIDQHNNMAVPNNIHVAGWYVNSLTPGQNGLSIIDGHSGGRYLDGIFRNLVKLKVDDQFTVEFGDKRIETFQIVSIDNYSTEQASKKMFEQSYDIQNQLNLITCGTNYNSDKKEYEDRVLVVAKNIN